MGEIFETVMQSQDIGKGLYNFQEFSQPLSVQKTQCQHGKMHYTVAHLDLELKRGGGGGVHLLALVAFLSSVISSFFIENKGPLP